MLLLLCYAANLLLPALLIVLLLLLILSLYSLLRFLSTWRRLALAQVEAACRTLAGFGNQLNCGGRKRVTIILRIVVIFTFCFIF